MNIVYLISEQNVKDLSPISYNCAMESPLTQAIYAAQVNYVQPALGYDFYAQLIAQVAGGTVTPNNALLLEQMQVWLAWCVYYVYMPHNWSKTKNAGTVHYQGDYYDKVDIRTLEYLRKDALSNINGLRKSLDLWICDNLSNYPLYCPYDLCKKSGLNQFFNVF